MSRKRCKCHPRDMYLTCVECPKCGHWSYEPMGDYGACERRKCAYEWWAKDEPQMPIWGHR